jgi:lysophospholipase L1-like esterase
LRAVDVLRSPSAESWEVVADGSSYWAVYDPDLGYRQNPAFKDMNALGFRDEPVGPKGDFRIVLLGDSLLVYGDTRDDTVAAHVRTSLDRREPPVAVDLINAGVKGYTNYQELLLLREVGIGLNPDLVGFAFCLNDLYTFLHSFDVDNGRLVPGTYRFSDEALGADVRPWWQRLATRSQLLVALHRMLPTAADAAEMALAGGYSFDFRLDVRNAWRDEAWNQIEQQLREAVDLGRRHGFEVFVVTFPVAVQYSPDYLSRDRAYVLKPQRTMNDICDRLAIRCHDLYPDLAAGLFVEDGLHLTGDGRRVSATSIADFLGKAKLIPE